MNSLAFSWTVSNFQPTSMTLIQNIPQSLEIDLSVLDRAFLMDMENPNLTHEFFLRAKDGHRMIESNRVVIRPKTPSKAKIQITQKEAGFCITNSLKNQLRIGDVIEVRVAYDQRDGSPLRAWGPEDFILGKMLNKRRTWGLDVKCVENVAAITIKDNEFNVEFSGFDNLRDLLINTKLVSQ